MKVNNLRIRLLLSGSFITLYYSIIHIKISASFFDAFLNLPNKNVIIKVLIYSLGFIYLLCTVFFFSFVIKNIILASILAVLNLTFIISLGQIMIFYNNLVNIIVIRNPFISSLLFKVIFKLDENKQI